MNVTLLQKYAPGPSVRVIPSELHHLLITGAQAQYTPYDSGYVLCQKITVCAAEALYIWALDVCCRAPEVQITFCATEDRVGLHYVVQGTGYGSLPPYVKLSLQPEHYAIYRLPKEQPLACTINSGHYRSVFLTCNLELLGNFADKHPALHAGMHRLREERTEGLLFDLAATSRHTENLLRTTILEVDARKVADPCIYYADKLLQLFLRYLDDLERTKGSLISQSKRLQLLKSITQYIHHNYLEPLTLADLSSRFYTSEDQLQKIFQRLTEKTVHLFITDVRLKHALALLHDPKYSISEVSELCGFQTRDTFLKAFRKKHKVSPTAFRAALLDNRKDEENTENKKDASPSIKSPKASE